MRTMSAREARDNFADLLGTVYYTKEAITIEKKGRPYAVVVSPEEYATMQAIKERWLAATEAIRARDSDREVNDVLPDMTGVVGEIWAGDDALDDLETFSPGERLAIEAGRHGYGTAEVSESGVDLSQLRHNLTLTPSERVERMVAWVNAISPFRGILQRTPR